MAPARNVRYFALASVLLPLLIAGCAAVADPPPRRTFLVQLDAAGSGGPASRRPARAVVVAPVVVAAPFSERGLVVRQSELGFETDPYAEFAASPASMWTEAIRGWLAARRLFERVLPSASSADAALTLEPDVLETVVDRRPGQAPSSRVTIRFLLVRNSAPYEVVLDRTFSHTEPVGGAGAESEVAALSRAANDVMRDLEGALAQLPD
jgi:uncharacterized lipoprotein YmbA